MKIKLYKQFKLISESNMEEYYRKLTNDEYIDLYEQIIDINNNFFDKIKNYLSGKFGCNKIYMWSKYKGLKFNNDIYGICISSRVWDLYIITQLDDEYFLVKKLVKDLISGPYNNEYSYYKCDQFDGLLKFFEDDKLIKVEK